MPKSTEAEEANSKLYELMVIVVPNIGEEKINNELDAIRGLIKEGNGVIVNEDIWGHRDLAYRIKKHDSGYYAVFNFESDGKLLPELEKSLKIEANILRHLLIKPPKGYIFKTQSEFEKEAEEMAAKDQSKKPAKRTNAPKVDKNQAPKKSTEQKEEKPAAKAKEIAKKPATEKKTEDNKKTLDELDEKLKSIIDDSDIDL